MKREPTLEPEQHVPGPEDAQRRAAEVLDTIRAAQEKLHQDAQALEEERKRLEHDRTELEQSCAALEEQRRAVQAQQADLSAAVDEF